LQRQRMLGTIMPKQALKIAVKHRFSSYHLSKEQRVRRKQTMEKPAMPIRPILHWRHREAAVNIICLSDRHHCFLISQMSAKDHSLVENAWLQDHNHSHV
jgi:hypothetical protein